MNCVPCRDWLLEADEPATLEAAPAVIAAHIHGCDACQELMCDLVQLDEAWRGLPLPAEAETSREAFIENLNRPATPHRPAVRPGRWSSARRWAGAAALFMIVGAGLLFFWPSQPVAASDLLDQLIDWNLDLSEAESAADRQRIYHEKDGSLKKALGHANLKGPDRELAENLLRNGAWMVDHEDPLEELDRYEQVADQILNRVYDAGPDAGRSSRFARQFRKIHERGIEKNLHRIKPDKMLDPEHKVKWNKFLRQDADRVEKIEQVMETAPDVSKKELRQTLELKHKRPKHHKDI